MARQKGHVKYVGTIGDIRHFKIKGQTGYFAGLTGGPTGEQVATAPAFERTRENMNEFGGSAKAGRAVRSVFSSVLGKDERQPVDRQAYRHHEENQPGGSV